MAADKGIDIVIPDGFERRDEQGVLLIVRRDLADAVHKALSPLRQAWSRMAQRRFSARGRTGVVSFPLGEARPVMMARRYAHGGLFAAIGRDLYWGPGRAVEELIVAEMAHRAGVRVPMPIGIIAQPAKGPLWRLAYLSAEIGDSEDMVHYCCRLGEYPAETAAGEKRGVLLEAARQIRKMHDLGIFHADLHLKNLLLRRRASGPPEVFIIDFDRAEKGESLSADQRAANLKRLARSVRKVRVADEVLTAWDRVRFLRDYLEGLPDRRALLRLWSRKLAVAGVSHEVWWTMTSTQRTLRGDKVGKMRKLSAASRRR